jgi:hypothetical protein
MSLSSRCGLVISLVSFVLLQACAPAARRVAPNDQASSSSARNESPLCLDSHALLACIGSMEKRCAPAPGEGCIRCTCVVTSPNTESRWGQTNTWSDKGDQNLMASPRIP